MAATEPDAPSSPPGPIQAVEGGLRVALRVQPKASRDRIDGVAARPDGARVLKLRVTAPPEDGKANAAAVKLLAKAWGLPKSAISIVAGAGGRDKTVHVSGDPVTLSRDLGAWLARFESG